ncbi:phage tail tip lysozyme [Candidatus Enterococcus courvalinii]|uniref:Peptidoglycan DD-metalloendopeptidase family protein n=1 Tax=Candidatus Enterococcus courvalinii TaxID=2815329 RepID=A0ABS3I106_9ENTE|nr:phage tail spike protein [Enterococcus sp. MSG2901]MBO0482010.1 peptidoglycan DD-metalloendopeptidase family protein [Enterococcus sp. MSG2901]
MNSSVYFFDNFQHLIKRKDAKNLIEVSQEKEITAEKKELLNDVLYVTTKFDETITSAQFMAVRESESSFSLYRITKISDPNETLEFTGIGFASDELDSYIINQIVANKQSIDSLLNELLAFTNGNWRVGYVEPGLSKITTTFDYVSVREALKQLQTFGMEFLFCCTLDSDGIKDKWIEVYLQIGTISNKRFTYGSKALTVIKEVDQSAIYTSIIGRGKGENVGSGQGKRLDFTNIEWKKSKGDPLDKPKGQPFLENVEATQKYGVPQKNGKMYKREKVVVFDDIDDPQELLQNTYLTLLDSARPLAQFQAEVTEGDVIGNTVTIHRYDKGYHYATRIYKTKINRLTGKATVELGDNLTKDTRKQSAKVATNLSELESTKMTFYQSTEIGKYQDDIMRGAGENGGSVYQVNGIEAGVSNSREVYETVYMDGENIPNSKYFMIENNSGISFKQCKQGQWKTIKDVHNGPSTTAWSLDGQFNANFIRTGILNGVLVEGVMLKSAHRNMTYQAVLDRGSLEFQYYKETPEDLNYTNENWQNAVEGEVVGRIEGTLGAAGKPNGFAVIQYPGQIFSINSAYENGSTGAVFQIPKESSGEKRKYKLLGEGTFSNGKIIFEDDVTFEGKVQVNGRLDAKELYINGVKIDTNGGGSSGGNNGSWNGQYPSEVTSDRDKRYWQIWAMAISAGFTKQAAAALLGNAQGESDANPVADEGNGVPGYGYGVWQWTDNTGVNSGRVYMINLMTQAGVTEDPDTITAQFKLLMWHSLNGQWIATSAYPLTWTQFMNLTDINTAAQAFVTNFERPRDPHPERSVWAQEWYDKFVNLDIPKNEGYTKPIASPITVTSEMGWRISPITGQQEFHNGIDLVNGNPNTPIFAAGDGEVITAGAEYFDWYGNYTVIKHTDGMFTGYAHQSRVDVSKGQTVVAGQQIGLMGTTGPSTGEHLHFQFMDEFYPSSSNHFHNPRNYIDF